MRMPPAGEPGRLIRTVHTVGYSFCGTAKDVDKTDRQAVECVPVCWLEWGRRRFPLTPGEHVIGRNPGVDVRFDAPTVCRRHAKDALSPFSRIATAI
jgi:hypothetical protein